VLVACIGSFTYGYVISVLGTTLSKPDFYIYMGLDTVGPGKGYAEAIIATWNCVLYVGAVFGGILYSFISDKWGRKAPIGTGSFLVMLGGALQAGSVNLSMLAGSRVIIGLGIGMLLPAVPLYQAEVSAPHTRGLMVGLHGKKHIPLCRPEHMLTFVLQKVLR
jgi:MFS family permease